ncbi:MAG: protein containing PKD domain-containing protein [Leeuwenhoekiella sp.]|nr:protein containing PKD domain-containing protein [Leeuwenhoekiella sp.]
MKLNMKHLALFVLAGIILSSCSDDDTDVIVEEAPLISNFEFGEGSTHGDEQVAYKGSDIHLEAEIVAEATVSSITLDIHAHDLEVGEGEEEWHFEQEFTDESYLVINPTFHEHVDVPATAPAGEYHITLTVTDTNGNSTEVEGHIQVLDPVTTSNLSIDESVARGSDFHAEFLIEAVHGVHNITVDIHAHGLTVGEGEAEWDFEQIFEEGYHGETSVEFHEHIDVPATAPVGEYHMVITIEDEEGNISEIDTHLDVTA